MRNIFKDSDLQKQFSEQGYVVVPFLNENEIEDLKTFFIENFYDKKDIYIEGLDELEYTLFSVVNLLPEFKKLGYNKIVASFTNLLSNILDNYKPIIGNYIAKYPNKGKLDIHQNWSLVDEDKFVSVSVWCPLQDSTIENGTLSFVPKSHIPFRGFRNSQCHESFRNIEQQILDKWLKPIEIKKGQAIILDDAIIHHSAINRTEDIRLACQLIMIPEEAKAYYFEFDKKSNKKVIQVEVDNEYFINMKYFKGQVENYTNTKKRVLKNRTWDIKSFEETMLSGQIPQKSFLKRLIERYG